MANWPRISIDMKKSLGMCFACGPDNPIGLKLRFNWDGKMAETEFTPTELHQGWTGIVHGGIITCLLDEAMSYAALFEKIDTVTARLQVRIRRPISIGEKLSIVGRVTKKTRKLAETEGTIFLKDRTVVAEATATQFVFNTHRSEGENDIASS